MRQVLRFLTFVTLTAAAAGQLSAIYEIAQYPLRRIQHSFRRHVLPTLWCGYHDSAPHAGALSSIYPNLDYCCRQHDHCPVIIERGTCLDGICNRSFLMPIMDCKCEDDFRKCLRDLPRRRFDNSHMNPAAWAEQILSEVTGNGYFNVIPRLVERSCIRSLTGRQGQKLAAKTKAMTARSDALSAKWTIEPLKPF